MREEMLKNVLSLKNIIWFCAIGLATFSGYYSVYGIFKLFAGGSFSIIGMATMLELAKLVVVGFLHNYHSTLKNLFKIYLTLSAVVLMAITSIGVYGYLTNSYQETAKTVNAAQNELTLLDQKRKMFESQKVQIETAISQKTERVSQYDKIRINQESSYSKLLEGKRGTRGLQQNIKGIDKTTSQLNDEISTLSTKSLAITDSINAIDQRKLEVTNSTFSSEMGPLLYLSRITGQPMDQIVNWFILFLVVVFDPLAVSLVIAANHISKVSKVGTGNTISGIINEFPEGKNDHTSTQEDTPVEPPDEWIDDTGEEIIESVQEDVAISNEESLPEELTSDEIVEDFHDEKIKDLEIKKELPILDHDLDQDDLDHLVDQEDQLELEDQIEEIIADQELQEKNYDNDNTDVTFEEQQSFYNELNHRVNRASGGI